MNSVPSLHPPLEEPSSTQSMGLNIVVKEEWDHIQVKREEAEMTLALTERFSNQEVERDAHVDAHFDNEDTMQDQETGDWAILDQILEYEGQGDSDSDSFLTDDEENYQDGLDPVEDVYEDEQEPEHPTSYIAVHQPLTPTAFTPQPRTSICPLQGTTTPKRKRSVSPPQRRRRSSIGHLSDPSQARGRSHSAERSRSPLHAPKPSSQTVQRWRTEKDPDLAPIPPLFLPARSHGLHMDTTVEHSPLGLFKLFFSGHVVKTLCDNTNKMADRNIARGRKYKWIPVTPPEVLKFIGIFLYMVVLKLPTVTDYWRQKNIFSVRFPGTMMVRDRYRVMSWNIHLNDPAEEVANDRKKGTAEYDPLFRLRPLMDEIRTMCQAFYHPQKNMHVGERVVATRTKTRMAHITKAKVTKCGFKVFVLSDSDNGYVWDFRVYTGKSRFPTGTGLSFDSVVQLINPSVLGTGYHLFCDRFHTSPRLFKHLRSLKFGACGPLHNGRKGSPRTKVNALTRRSPRGSLRWIREDQLLFARWMDNREVSVCSSIHPAYMNETVKRRLKKGDANWKEVQIPIPTPVAEYNKHVGGVELSDQLMEQYTEHHKTKRWYRTMFFHFVDIVVTNCHILHKELCQIQQTDPVTYRFFVERLVAELCGVSLHVPPMQTRTGHTPVPISVTSDPSKKATAGRQRCKKCRNDGVKNLSPWKCNECNVALCLIVDRNCFHQWHNM